tara:strand:- start:24 stop:419 length:396 start_codon:yes stop_codon:yes gene_type:complete
MMPMRAQPSFELANLSQPPAFAPASQRPMSISIFGGGMPGGGIANFLQPLSNYLRNQVSQEQIDPFIQEVTQMAQERFNLQNGGSFPQTSVDSYLRAEGLRPVSFGPDTGIFPNKISSPAFPTFGQQARLF